MTMDQILAAIAEMEEEELTQLAEAVNEQLKGQAGEGEGEDVQQQEGEGGDVQQQEGEGGEDPAEAVSEPAEEIQQMVEAIGEELDQIEQVVEAIEDRRSTLKEHAAKRGKLIEKLRKGEEGTVVQVAPGVQKRSESAMEFDQKKEYRAAWANKMRGLPLTDLQKRAYSNTVGSGAEVVPEELQNEIITKVKTMVPLLGEITVLHTPGNIRFAVEGVTNAAGVHQEGAEISDSSDTLTEVFLGAYEIAKLLSIGDTVRAMSIAGFEAWVVDQLSEAIARKIEDLLINGDGTNKPTGIEKANTWVDNTNQITVAANTDLDGDDIRALFALLNNGYIRDSKLLMNSKMFYSTILGLEDDAKNKCVSFNEATGEAKVYGRPVLISDWVSDNTIYMGNFKKMIANFSEEVNVHTQYDIRHNSYLYSGVAIFDSKPALGEAFVKLVKATA